MSAASKSRVGRPRAQVTRTHLSPKDEILDAAAALFVENGFAATTTRAIAERVGIRQASLYYHFAGKDDILLELLERTVRPGLEIAEALNDDAAVSPSTALYTLARRDAQALAATPHNIGSLYLLPEVAQERYDGFRAFRAQLRDAYGRLGIAAASEVVRAEWTADDLGAALIQMVEIVIPARRDAKAVDPGKIASACLRICGLSPEEIVRARTAALRD